MENDEAHASDFRKVQVHMIPPAKLAECLAEDYAELLLDDVEGGERRPRSKHIAGQGFICDYLVPKRARLKPKGDYEVNYS